MKTLVLSLLLIVMSLAGGGCAMLSPEDRDFYGKGWVRPTDLDKEPLNHKIVDPSHPETMTAATAPTTRTAPAAEPAPEWITPIPSAQ